MKLYSLHAITVAVQCAAFNLVSWSNGRGSANGESTIRRWRRRSHICFSVYSVGPRQTNSHDHSVDKHACDQGNIGTHTYTRAHQLKERDGQRGEKKSIDKLWVDRKCKYLPKQWNLFEKSKWVLPLLGQDKYAFCHSAMRFKTMRFFHSLCDGYSTHSTDTHFDTTMSKRPSVQRNGMPSKPTIVLPNIPPITLSPNIKIQYSYLLCFPIRRSTKTKCHMVFGQYCYRWIVRASCRWNHCQSFIISEHWSTAC